MAVAYERLSPEFQKRLHGLQVLHSGMYGPRRLMRMIRVTNDVPAVEQAQRSEKGGGVVRREPVQNVHPLVRTHPVSSLQKNILASMLLKLTSVGYWRESAVHQPAM